MLVLVRYDDACSNSFFQLKQHSEPHSLGLANVELVAQKVSALSASMFSLNSLFFLFFFLHVCVLSQIYIRELCLVIVYFERHYYAMVQALG